MVDTAPASDVAGESARVGRRRRPLGQRLGPNGFLLGPAGSKNFRNLFDEPDLPGILERTAVWVVVVVCVTMLLSLALAQLFNQVFPGRRVTRWALIAPWAA